MNEFDRHLIKTTTETKGDWKPVVYLFTDGRPTDECKGCHLSLAKKVCPPLYTDCTGNGEKCRLYTLKQLAEHRIAFDELNEKIFQSFSNGSVPQSSHKSKVWDGEQQQHLPPLDERYMRLIKDVQPRTLLDEQVQLCWALWKLNRPYLMKFEREIQYQAPKDLDINLNLYHYQLKECCKIDEDYFTWSDQSQHQQQINTTLFEGAPECPHCLAETAFAMCGLNGQLMFMTVLVKKSVVRGAAVQVSFGYGGSDGFDVQRGRG